MWGYYWEYTAAQIELMVADCPLTVYDSISNKDKKGKKEKFGKADGLDVAAKAREWQEKYGSGENGVKLDLSGFCIK